MHSNDGERTFLSIPCFMSWSQIRSLSIFSFIGRRTRQKTIDYQWFLSNLFYRCVIRRRNFFARFFIVCLRSRLYAISCRTISSFVTIAMHSVLNASWKIIFVDWKDKDRNCLPDLFVSVVFWFHFRFFDWIARLIVDYDEYHVNVFVNGDPKLTKR